MSGQTQPPNNEIKELSEEMLIVGMNMALLMSGGLALILAYRYFNLGYSIPCFIELCRSLAVSLLWVYGKWSGNPKKALRLQIAFTWTGVSAMTLAQGGITSPNLIWSIVLCPMAVLAGFKVLGWALCVGTAALAVMSVVLDNLSLLPEDILIIPGQRAFSAILCLAVFMMVCTVILQWRQKLSERLETEHLRAQEMAVARSGFLLRINHELRNSLMPLISASEDLAASTGKDDVEDKVSIKLAKTLESTAKHLLRVVNDVLESERLQAEDSEVVMQNFSIESCIENVKNIYENQAASHTCKIDVDMSECGTDRWVGNEAYLSQALSNLLSNSIKHGGNCAIVIAVKESETGIEISVSDNGAGIEESRLVHVFDPFKASRGKSGSTGLGLPICKILVEKKLGGEISVDSKVGIGTTFNMKLPFLKAPVEYVGTSEAKDKSIGDFDDLTSKTILIVEDDITNLETLGLLFEKRQVKVHMASNMNEAIELIEKVKFDAFLIDRNLGESNGTDGVHLTKEIRKLDQGPVIGFTGNCTVELEDEWMAAGAVEVIAKPMSFLELCSRVANAIKKKD